MTSGTDWRDVLKDKVQEFWDAGRRALVLSRVPALLKDAGIDIEPLLAGRKLRPFLASECGEGLQLVQSEKNPIIWGLLPATVNATPPYDQYLYRPTGERPRRFAPAVWRAFVTPIEAGRRRWLTDEPSVHFSDLPEDEAPTAAHEVERRFVVDAVGDSEVDRALVISRIGEWAAEQKLDPTRFELGRRKPPLPQPDGARTRTRTDSAPNALDQFLGLLLPSELTRISIPLDVVARLRSTPVRDEG